MNDGTVSVYGYYLLSTVQYTCIYIKRSVCAKRSNDLIKVRT